MKEMRHKRTAVRVPAARSRLHKELVMEKNTRTWNGATWKDAAEEAASIILQRSMDRMIKVEGPYLPKAYMALALAASEAIRAFLALDASMK
jgi:hypothetical protein